MRLSLLLLALILGCAGNHFAWDDARRVQLGMSEAEVQAIMGKPNVVTSSDQGVKWTYAYGTALGTGAHVSFAFQSNRVVRVPQIPSSFK